jgi:Uma2 family endonuclease
MTKETAAAIADRLVTAEELYEHPEWGRCELHSGRVKFMSPAGAEHGSIAIKIALRLGAFIEKHGLGELFAAETGFFVTRNPDTVAAPDVMFLSKGRIPAGGIPKQYLPIAPDLAVEVVSPFDRFSELTEKAESYIRAGVKLVWIVDPQTRRAHVYRPGKAMQTLTTDQSLSGEEVLPGFELALNEILK